MKKYLYQQSSMTRKDMLNTELEGKDRQNNHFPKEYNSNFSFRKR